MHSPSFMRDLSSKKRAIAKKFAHPKRHTNVSSFSLRWTRNPMLYNELIDVPLSKSNATANLDVTDGISSDPAIDGPDTNAAPRSYLTLR
jgi:hypothetical protein